MALTAFKRHLAWVYRRFLELETFGMALETLLLSFSKIDIKDPVQTPKHSPQGAT